MNAFWTQLDRRGRTGLLGGASLIAISLIVAAIWLLRTDYHVLFADLKPQDTAAFAAELDKQKIPYRIGGDGNTILVASDIVHATRLKLMGKDIPLQGAAGFELFNNSDFGMTEFAQKINYQRALQGEITRTILALAEVRDARVHLALPEEGLFKRASARGKAAITLGLQAGAALRPDQVMGIQRLVAAAVPGIAAQDVTIVDQRGIALTRPAGEGGIEQGSARLDLKKETEQLLARKAGEVLDRAFGAGQAIVSVDVTLNMDMVKTTSEEVLGGRGRTGNTGVVVREREVTREAVAPLDQRNDERPANLQREVEYQTGRRIEQMVSQPGAVRRIQAVAVVSKALDAQQLEQMRALIAAAVGATPERGDVVVVQSLKAFESRSVDGGQGAQPPTAAPPAATERPRIISTQAAPANVVWWLGVALLLAGALAAAWFWRSGRAVPVAGGRALSHADREAALRQIQGWLDGGSAGNAGSAAALPATVPPLSRGGP